jgi:hypothetical protein
MCAGQSPIGVVGAGRWRGQYKYVVVVLNAMVSTSNSTTVAQANRCSALPNAEGVLGQRGVGKGVVPGHSSLRLMSARKESKRSRQYRGDSRGESESQSGTESHISYREPWSAGSIDPENTIPREEVEEPNWGKVRISENGMRNEQR